MTLITIANNGPTLVDSNYWDTEHAARGFCYVTANASALRLLVPDASRSIVAEMKTGIHCEISVGDGVYSLLFEDGSDDPFVLALDTKQFDRVLTPGKCALIVYGRGPVELFRLECVITSHNSLTGSGVSSAFHL